MQLKDRVIIELLLKIQLFCFAFLILNQAHSDTISPLLLGHFRIGMVSGSFTGVESGSFSVPLSLEGEGEYIYTPKNSALIRTTISLEPDSGQFKYVYMGLGQKFYLLSRIAPLETMEGGNLIKILPNKLYYINYDVGLSQIQVKKVTDSLTVESTLVEFGLSGGLVWKISQRVGFVASLGFSKGFPVSPVSVDSTIIRATIGLSSFF